MPNIPETWLGEQTVNTTTTGGQFSPRVIQLANGNILVIWTSDDNTGVGSSAGLDVIGQIFNPAGEKVGGEFRVNNFGNANDESVGDIAPLPNGGFVITYNRTVIGTGVNTICVDTYDANGNVGLGSFIQDDVAGDPVFGSPQISISSATSALIVYTETTGGVSNIRARLFDPSTNTVGAQISLIAFAGGNTDPDVTVLNNGNYVITSRNVGTDSYINFRIVSPTGANVLGATEVSGTNTNNQADFEPTITSLAGGGFVIAWTNTDTNDTDVQFRIYDASGNQVGSGDVAVGSATNQNNEPVVVGLADGTFVIYYDNDELDRQDVERFSATGSSLGIFNFAGGGTSGAAVALADGRSAFVMSNFTSNELSLEILDTRDAVNATPVNSTNLQVGTNDGDTFTVNGATGTAYGGAGNDVITSDGSTNIFGGEGNDYIIAGLGTAELLDGGNGIDTIDTTLWSGDYNLNLVTGVTNYPPESYVNFENVVTGVGNDNIVGSSAFNNISTGDGNDTVTSGGNGLFNLGAGNDTFVAGNTFSTETADGGTGVDTLDLTVGNFVYSLVNLATGATNYSSESFTNFENVTTGNQNDTLFGTTGNNILNGGDGNDILAGLGGNDTLIGGAGSNQYIGSTGNDTYIVQAANPGEAVLQTLFEAAGEGTDSVQVTTSVFSLEWFGSSELENLTLTDNAAHTAIGNAFGNTLTGGTGADDLFGRAGDDTLIGGSGTANTLLGQQGNDVYIVTATGDSVIEFVGEGSDRVEASVASFTLRDNVENLTFTGANTARIGVGNDQSNLIRSLGGDDSINGLGGDDVIIAGSGADLLQGGGGSDQFRYEGGETGLDRILDFLSGTDKIALRSSFFTPTGTVSFVSGVGATANTANSTILYDPSTGIVSYDDDGNGAGAAVQLAQLNAGQTFTASDFLFY